MGRSIPPLNALFAAAMVKRCGLAEAAKECPDVFTPEVMREAIKYRCTIATGGSDGKGKWYEYEESIYEAFKRLEMAN